MAKMRCHNILTYENVITQRYEAVLSGLTPSWLVSCLCLDIS